MKLAKLVLKNKNIHSLSLFITKNCNMKCSYCYIKQKNEDMSEVVLKKSIYFFLASDGDVKRIIFSGGEPLFKIDILKKALAYISLISKKFPHKKVKTILNTNGTILNDGICELIQNIDYVSVSLDGSQTTFDIHRRAHNNSSVFKQVIKNYCALHRIYPEKIIINKVITSQTVESLHKDVFFIYSHLPLPKYISLNIALADLGWNKEKVIKLFKNAEVLYLWMKKNGNDKRLMDTFKLLFRALPAECALAYLTLDCKGNLYPCEILSILNKDRVGNLVTGELKEGLADCAYSPNNRICKLELCRECNQICTKINFIKGLSNFDDKKGSFWLLRARGFQSFFWKRYLTENKKINDSKHDMLNTSLRIF